MKNNRFWLLIIGGIGLLSICAVILLPLIQQEGDVVTVKVDGETRYTLSLHEDQSLTVLTESDGYNTITIEGGKVQITQANCPDLVCTRHRATNVTADSIVCLPHRLVVSVSSQAGPNLDGVVG